MRLVDLHFLREHSTLVVSYFFHTHSTCQQSDTIYLIVAWLYYVWNCLFFLLINIEFELKIIISETGFALYLVDLIFYRKTGVCTLVLLILDWNVRQKWQLALDKWRKPLTFPARFIFFPERWTELTKICETFRST